MTRPEDEAPATPAADENKLIAERRQKLALLNLAAVLEPLTAPLSILSESPNAATLRMAPLGQGGTGRGTARGTGR